MLTKPQTSQADSSLVLTALPMSHRQQQQSAESEAEKLEKKRERNRIAAQQCRKRKLEKIKELSHEVNELRNVNSLERAKSKRLKEEIEMLMQTIRTHKGAYGCDLADIEL